MVADTRQAEPGRHDGEAHQGRLATAASQRGQESPLLWVGGQLEWQGVEVVPERIVRRNLFWIEHDVSGWFFGWRVRPGGHSGEELLPVQILLFLCWPMVFGVRPG